MMTSVAKHIIAVDGGGSTCRVAIATSDGEVIGMASGAAANPSTSFQQAITCLRNTLESARVIARLSKEALSLSRVHIGLAGVINQTIAERVAAAMPFDKVSVTDDRPTGMAGALKDQSGFMAALGTGSYFGAQREGQQRFIGGWGFQLGDEASGAWLGRKLLSRLLAWQDGFYPPSPLLKQTLTAFEGEPSNLVLFATEALPDAFARLAPQIITAAREGDETGCALMREGAEAIQKALDGLGFHTGDLLCLTGGVGTHFAPYLAEAYKARLLSPLGSALDGALFLAQKANQGRLL